MTTGTLTLAAIDAQEVVLADAFRSGEIAGAGHLYHPDVVYSSPTTRLFGWPRRIIGRDRTLEFIQLTIAGLEAIDYALDERAVITGTSAYTRILFDFDTGGRELYYDPSDRLEDSPV
jgi:hypothetical protein